MHIVNTTALTFICVGFSFLIRRCILFFHCLDRMDEKPNTPNRNSYIGHIEDTGTQRANTQIHKIDDLPLIADPVDQVADSATQQEGRSYPLSFGYSLGSYEEDEYRGKKDSHENGENPILQIFGYVCPQTQKTTEIFGIVKAENIIEETKHF